jgi:hypothetical protein
MAKLYKFGDAQETMPLPRVLGRVWQIGGSYFSESLKPA